MALRDRRVRTVLAVLVAAPLAATLLVATGLIAAEEREQAGVSLRGAGATLPAPLYDQWIQTYRRQHPEVAIAYEAVGSGEGQRRFLAEAVDFGASDAALTDEQMGRARAGTRLVPVTAGMIVLAYNLPGLNGPLKLPRDAYVDILAGRVRTWNHPRLRASNPGLNLPNRSIALVARHDSSGTTYALTNHLAAIGGSWTAQSPGVGNLVDWSGRAMLARGNEGVAARIKVSADSIGYVEYHFARRLGLPMAWLQNRAGRYVEPSAASGQASLTASAPLMPANLRLFVPDPEGAESYPVVTFSWLLLHERYADARKAAALKAFVAWGLTNGQAMSRDLGYIPLPAEVATRSLAALDRVN